LEITFPRLFLPWYLGKSLRDEYGLLVSTEQRVQVLGHVSTSTLDTTQSDLSAMSYGVLPESYDLDAYAEAVNVAQSM
jgi:hypothetical protein